MEILKPTTSSLAADLNEGNIGFGVKLFGMAAFCVGVASLIFGESL